MNYTQEFDVLVIGGGHAGTEAALAAARRGSNTLLLTHKVETLGELSCNPAIGGIGKSHLLREVDALGGAIAKATDLSGIQFRVLNSRKGAAVRATRAQTDRSLYKQAIRSMLENQPNLLIFQQAADDLIVEGTKVVGVVTNTGIQFRAKTVVLTAGTFLGGVIHLGLDNYAGGRAGDPPSTKLAARMRELNLRVGRLKTGTPPRIDARSVDFSVLEEQPTEAVLPVMSYLGCPSSHPRQVSCHITHTNERTHEIINANLHRSPMYAGVIEGVGPRYCPSIEDKVQRFSDKNSHQIFLEPEGLHTHELYPNGISTSLPFDTQVELVHSMKGLENAHITRPGYAIEYDYFNPQDLHYSLETKALENLFFAGQINGTTGYEEAAAQGILAGLNASLKADGKEPWHPTRSEAYLGVLIDDLITLGTSEPYRMFTSRAEHRLLLREDNADMRLTAKGYELGLITPEHWQAFCAKQEAIDKQLAYFKATYIQPKSAAASQLNPLLAQPLDKEYSLEDLLKRPELSYESLLAAQPLPEALSTEKLAADINYPLFRQQVGEQVEIQTKYAGYIARQLKEIDKHKRQESLPIPKDFDFSQIKGLSNEVRSKLIEVHPATLGQASRIPGLTPAGISILLVHLKKQAHLAGQKTDAAQSEATDE